MLLLLIFCHCFHFLWLQLKTQLLLFCFVWGGGIIITLQKLNCLSHLNTLRLVSGTNFWNKHPWRNEVKGLSDLVIKKLWKAVYKLFHIFKLQDISLNSGSHISSQLSTILNLIMQIILFSDFSWFWTVAPQLFKGANPVLWPKISKYSLGRRHRDRNVVHLCISYLHTSSHIAFRVA